MSVRQSEKIVVACTPDWSKISMPFLMASDSAIRRELTDSKIWEPDWVRSGGSPIKFHAVPALFEEASQAASMKQGFTGLESSVCGGGRPIGG